MYKNASAAAYPLGPSSASTKVGSVTHHDPGHHNTIEGGHLTKEHLNESSNYLSDDPLLRSN